MTSWRGVATEGPKVTVLWLLLCLAPSGNLRAQVVQSNPRARQEIRGIVTDSATGMPLEGAFVALTSGAPRTVTDVRGQFSLTWYFGDSVVVIVRAIGFTPYTRTLDPRRATGSLTVRMVKAVVQLEAVRVRDDSVARFLATAQVSATLSGEQLRQRRGQTLGETLRDMPGVAIVQYGPSIAKPVVRGLQSQRIATINAGVSQEGQQWGGEHAPEVDAFAASEIEVIRGAGTILYGSGAIGGVVRVTPRRLPIAGPIGASLELNGFLNNRQRAGSFMIEGAQLPLPWIGDAGWRVQISGRQAGDARTASDFLPNTGFRELDASAAMGVQRPWGQSTLTLSHFGTNLGLYLGAHVGNLDDLQRAISNPLTSGTFSSSIGRPNQLVRHDLLSWRTDRLLADGSSVNATYGFQYNQRQEFDSRGFAAASPRPAFALELFTHSLDLQYHHVPRAGWTGTLGVSGMRQGNLSPGRSFLIPQYRLYTSGIYALEQRTISRVTMSVGARFDARYQHAYQFGAPVIVSPDVVNRYTGPSAALTALYRVSETWSLSTTATRAWRPPNVNERFSQGVHHGTAQYELGDSSLGPERSMDADITLRHQRADRRLEISPFVRRIDDFIFLRPRDPVVTVRGTYPAYAYAHANARMHGVEFTGEITLMPWLQMYANANVVRGIDHADGSPLYDMPADRATVSARAFLPASERWTAPYVEMSSTLVRRQDQLPAATVYRLPTAGYALLHLSIGASTVRWGAVRVEPTLTVRNLLDTRYRDYLSRYRLFVDEPGRDVVFRLTIPIGHVRNTP